MASGSNYMYHELLRQEARRAVLGTPASNRSTQDSMQTTTTLSRQSSGSSTKSSPALNWDLQATSFDLYPAFDFLAHHLEERNLSISLIVSNQAPFIVPVWSIAPRVQLLLLRLVRSACMIFKIQSNWMTYLSSLDSTQELSRVFDSHKPDSHIIRKSLLQREIIYSKGGLTLLTVDHVFTLKRLLCTLPKRDWLPNARAVCLRSCCQLFGRIDRIYTGNKFSKAYMRRAYPEIPFQETAFDEVVLEHTQSVFATAKICTPEPRTTKVDESGCSASIRDLTLDLNYGSYTSDSVVDGRPQELWVDTGPPVELEDTSTPQSTTSAPSDWPLLDSREILPAPQVDIKLSDLPFLVTESPKQPFNTRTSSNNPVSPLSITSPAVKYPNISHANSSSPSFSPVSSHNRRTPAPWTRYSELDSHAPSSPVPSSAALDTSDLHLVGDQDERPAPIPLKIAKRKPVPATKTKPSPLRTTNNTDETYRRASSETLQALTQLVDEACAHDQHPHHHQQNDNEEDDEGFDITLYQRNATTTEQWQSDEQMRLTAREIVTAWTREVPDLVCAKCCVGMEAPRRYSLCF